MPSLEVDVWVDHVRVATFPADFTWSHDPDDHLVVKNGAGKTVAAYDRGQWHAIGTGIVCAFREASADCPNCKQKGEA